MRAGRGSLPSRALVQVLVFTVLFFLGYAILESGAKFADNRPAVAMPGDSATKPRISQRLNHRPLTFELNRGQSDPQVKFLSHGNGSLLFLTKNEAVLEVSHASKANSIVRLGLAGANPRAAMVGVDELETKSNYFIGNDSSQWRTDIPNFGKVKYESVYPGVDLVFYGRQGQLEFDFVVRPGADLGQVRFAVHADARAAKHRSSGLRIDSNGDLVIGTAVDELRLPRPLVYQAREPSGLALDAHYVLAADGTVRFDVPKYDPSHPLIIDPVLTYSTFLGGSGNDLASGIAVDASGDAYVVGQTLSTNFPLANAYQSTCNGCGSNLTSAFVTEFNPSGSALVYSTYLGGTGGDSAAGVAVDSLGNAYVVGTTTSADFPTTAGAFQTACTSCGVGQPDVFVTKLAAGGAALSYSTYLGGSKSDSGAGIAVWQSGGSAYAIVTGRTVSDDFPLASAMQTTCNGCDAGNSDAFVTELDPAGATLVYSTYLGGTGADQGLAIAVDSTGSAYITGSTTSNDIRSVNAFQPFSGGNQDGFVTKFSPNGQTLDYFSYLGGSGNDQGTGIAVDSNGDAYVTGSTASTDFPTDNPIIAKLPGGQAAFVTKVASAGSSLIFSTYLGGSGTSSGASIALDSAGNCYVTGSTSSPDFPLASPLPSTGTGINQGTNGDAFVTKINSTGAAIIFSSYLGGSDVDAGSGIAVDSSGNAYVAGSTFSANFPTANAYQPAIGGQYDAFVTELSGLQLPTANVSPSSLTFGNQPVNTTSAPQPVTLTNNGDASLTITSIVVASMPASPVQFAETDNCDGSVAAGASCTINVTFTPTSGGAETGTLTITDSAYGSPQTVALTGTGTNPLADLTPGFVNFGGQGVGTTSAAQAVTLSNPGNSTLTITSIAVTAGFAETDTCGSSVAAGANCTISITFSPTALGGVNGSLTVTDNASNSPQSVPLAGTGIVAFSLSATPTSQTISKGTDSTTFTVSAATQFGFTGAIALSCQNSSPANCSFNPASITAGQSSTLTLNNLAPLVSDSLNFQVVGTSGTQTTQIALQVLIPDFGLLIVPTSSTVTAGQSATYTLSISPINGFNQQVNLTCLGAPQTVTCSASPASVTLDGMTTSKTTITVATTARTTGSGAFWPIVAPPAWPALELRWLTVLGGLVLVCLISSGRRRARLVLASCALIMVAFAACSVGGKRMTGTPAGTYQLQVQGANATSSLTHSVLITVVVQ